MNLIRITTDLDLTVHEFPDGTYDQQNEALRRLIGQHCDIYEHVMPKRLYTKLGVKRTPSNIPGRCVCMLVDEEGGLKELEPNMAGSYLYETDKHGNPILGNILLVGEKWDREGLDFCGIDDAVFESLKLQLDSVILKMKEQMEVLGI